MIIFSNNTNPETDRVNHGIERRSGGTEAMFENATKNFNAVYHVAANSITITGAIQRLIYEKNLSVLRSEVNTDVKAAGVSATHEEKTEDIINRSVIANQDTMDAAIIDKHAIKPQPTENSVLNYGVLNVDDARSRVNSAGNSNQ